MDKDRTANAFRRWGYLQANIDPLNRIAPFAHPELDEEQGKSADKWRSIYCGKIGVEFMHMPYPERCAWVAERMEESSSSVKIDRKAVFKRILHAETFERFLHTRYVGAKRFSLEGIAGIIPLLDVLLDRAANQGFEIVMIGMSHRGRLNVMHHIANTLTEHIVASFEDVDPRSALGSDDVKYHKGANGVYTTLSDKELIVALSSNPSHLEAINPVLRGRIRARQERLEDKSNDKVLGILMHGDAAFAGQGIAAESLNLSEVPGYRIGGTVHIIINNMIGFTTTPRSLYSTRYSSDLAKRLNIPIFHVNAESPDHIVHVASLAQDYRQRFNSDVLIDLIGYRRYGHSEIDDPTLTSPLLYSKIQQMPVLFERYANEVGITEQEIEASKQEALENLEEGLKRGRMLKKKPRIAIPPNYWEPYIGGYDDPSLNVPTGISSERLQSIAASVTRFPANFNAHRKVEKLFNQRAQMGLGEKPVDWGMAETLAFGSLLQENIPVRLTGQDCRRGTFNHRHAVVYDITTEDEWIPLVHVNQKQARFDVYDTILSEAAVLGFEYGFSRDYPEALICWEAQFGDFANSAQVIIDQFISSGEDKWETLSGIVLLLPHGFEGQGPEHSSARLERFLHSAAKDNFQVCQPSNAAQYFHLLRRQALRKWRKPLIVMTPKSMLRAQAACSSLEEFVSGSFQHLVDDEDEFRDADRILFCTGKVVHELKTTRKNRKDKHTAIISVEQLYPLPEEELSELLSKYKNAKTIVWVQEEPANMGANSFIRPHLERLAKDRRVTAVRRSASASPATGSSKAHALEQEALLKLAFMTYG